MASGPDPAFAGAGKAPGMELWRIENLAPVKQDKVDGKFHVGDSYILLVTQKKGTSLQWNVHFWLGAESSQDERGVAAYKTVELDDALGGAPVQYREVQENESGLFLSYFKDSGIEYVPGGVASGFTKVERDVYRTRLLQVKGSRVVRAKEVPLTSASLNTSDVFILDAGLKLYLYNGAKANRGEKGKAIEVIQRIKDAERGGRAEIIIVNDDPHNAEFWEALGGEIEVTAEGESDEAADKAAARSITLSRVSDASGKLEVTPVPTPDGKLTRDMLDTSDVFILDVGSEIFVWIGKGTTAEEKKSGMSVAVTFLQQTSRPDSTPITRLIEGVETAVFKSFFKQWDPPRQMTFGFQGSRGVALSPTTSQKVDVKGMLERVQANEAPVDDGSGKLTIWRIENLEKVEVPKDKYGHFYAGDSYVLLYEYNQGSKVNYIIYMWQGSASSTDEKAACALQAIELDKQYGDAPVQVRVVQGKEPAHFRQLFKGKMVVHSGGIESGFKNKKADEGATETPGGPQLYHVKGSTELNTYAAQVPAAATSLNSGDCFVLVLPDEVFVWAGTGGNDFEKDIALAVANNLKTSQTVVPVSEGEEPDAFWDALGGKTEYPTIKEGEELPKEPRLFQLSNATGSMKVDEIFNFAQSDLVHDDVMLLDTYTTVFVWVGAGSNEAEKAQAITVAQEYIDNATDGRDPSTPIVKVTAGNEPSMFTQHFIGWDEKAAKGSSFVDPYEEKQKKLREEATSKPLASPRAWTLKKSTSNGPEASAENGAPANNPPPAPVSRPKSPPATPGKASPPPKVPQAASSPRKAEPPAPAPSATVVTADGADPTKREALLSDAEFLETFKMDKAAFYAMPKWKQINAKKAVGLF